MQSIHVVPDGPKTLLKFCESYGKTKNVTISDIQKKHLRSCLKEKAESSSSNGIITRYNDNTDEFTLLFILGVGYSECALITGKQADSLCRLLDMNEEGVAL